MITKSDTLLSKRLIEKKLVAPEALEAVVQEAAKSKESLFALLGKKGVLAEDELLRNLSEATKTPLLEAEALKADPAVVAKVPLKIAEYYRMVPLKLDKKKLTIAVSAPLDLRSQDDMRTHLGCEVEAVYAREKDVVEAQKRFYGFAAGTIEEIMAQAPAGAAVAPDAASLEKVENIEKMAGDASIAKLVNQIILEAYRKRATDIHIEPYRGKVKLRYRIDGVLYNANVEPQMARLILPILSRIKIMSNLNIVEKRLPQDGRAIVQVEDTQLDLRVSSIPTPYGESVVIRMLPMNRIFDLAKLGLSEEQFKIFEALINKPHGIIFITGPTGSGKSTTLYACLRRINTEERKIITIEDPIEYELEGVTQIQVQPAIGLDFAKGLRSMLRHDPDVMMVGEVRDLETAEIAIRVALTGHLVFSTLHTNTAAGGITRLVDIGVPPYLIASSVEAFIAQRLVRLICAKCKEEDRSDAAKPLKSQIAADLGIPDAEVHIWKGRGCNDCNGTGFWGRVAIYEVLLASDKLKGLIMSRAPASEIQRTAVAQGMRTLKQDGWLKVIKGLTTPDEILEVVEEARDEVREEEAAPEDRQAAPAARRGPEGRFFQRIEERVNVRYRLVRVPAKGGEAARPGPEQFTGTRDLSAGGLLFLAQEPLAAGSVLELKLEIPDGEDPLECLGRVVRTEEVESGKFYETAVCFLDLAPAVRGRIDRFVRKRAA
jgi:type II secretory ATPase GspE/PulE/Tfp pilus assembly ATPase PilB-like protein